MNKSTEIAKALKTVSNFIGHNQLICIGEGLRGEEKSFFVEKLISIEKTIEEMPKTYETDGQGDKAIATLHYFKGGKDWYIVEKDMGCQTDTIQDKQHQAYGLANIGMGFSQGYISIQELIENNVELDMYFTPCTIGEIKKSKERITNAEIN